MKKTLLSCIFAFLILMIFSIITEANCIKILFPNSTPIFISNPESKPMFNSIPPLNSEKVSMTYSYITEIQVINKDLMLKSYTLSVAKYDKIQTGILRELIIKNTLKFQGIGYVSKQFADVEQKQEMVIPENSPGCNFSNTSTGYPSVYSQPTPEFTNQTNSSYNRQPNTTGSNYWKQKPFNSVRTLTNFKGKSLIKKYFAANGYTVYKQKSISVVYISNFLPVTINTTQGPNSYLTSLIIDLEQKT